MKQHTRQIDSHALQDLRQLAQRRCGGVAGADSVGFLHRSRLSPDKQALGLLASHHRPLGEAVWLLLEAG